MALVIDFGVPTASGGNHVFWIQRLRWFELCQQIARRASALQHIGASFSSLQYLR